MSKTLDAQVASDKEKFPKWEWQSSGFDIVYNFWKNNVNDASIDTYPEFIKDFFIKGYDNRPSVRKSNETGTIPDIVIDKLIKARVSELKDKDIDLIRFGHRLSMSAENILGLILEEYIHDNVLKYGWSCCWGNCIKSVDFCSSKNMLLQVKNRSNTENSSSNKIRQGTKIEKWYRINAQNGKTHWDELNRIIGVRSLMSESDFIDFAKALIKDNPSALFVNKDEYKKLFGK